MAYFVTVTRGANQGRTYRVEPGECTIGRSPANTIVIDDESAAWEHALLREDDGKLVLQNLSALGTRVKGRRVTDEARLSSRDEIELSDTCRLRVDQRLAGRAPSIPRRGLLWGAAALLVLSLGAAALWLARPPEPPPRRVTRAHWKQAYDRIERRLELWTQRNVFPEEALEVYRSAWRLEQALNPAAAARQWDRMRALLLTLPFPGSDDDTRIVEMAGTDSKALRVIMGWDVESSSTDFRWNTDEAYADALVWFVRRRAEYTRRDAEEQR